MRTLFIFPSELKRGRSEVNGLYRPASSLLEDKCPRRIWFQDAPAPRRSKWRSQAQAAQRLQERESTHLVPDGEVGQQAFAVIHEAIRKEGMVALGRVVSTSMSSRSNHAVRDFLV
jgi:hypothetical protein